MKTINSLNRLLVLVFLGIMSYSCDQEETMIFETDGSVYFTTSDYSYFFLDYPGKQIDTIKLPVQIFGKTADVDRLVKIELVTDDTSKVNTAPEELYSLIGGVVPANEQLGSVSLELKYADALQDTVYVFYVRIVPDDDFEDVSYNSRIVEVLFTAKEIQPANWNGYLRYFWGDYSTCWWKFIKEATDRTSIPYWPGNADQDTWWMSDSEFEALQVVVKRELKKYNETHETPLTHDDGPSKGKEVQILY